jgi:uncharacterized protein
MESQLHVRSSGRSVCAGAVSERIDALDILRGLALFGMVLYHFSLFAGGGGRYGTLVLQLTNLLVHEKARALFGILFGVSFALMLRRADARGQDIRGGLCRRLVGIAFFGLVTEGLFGFPVLMSYAVSGVWLLAMSRWRKRALVVAFFVAASIGGGWNITASTALSGGIWDVVVGSYQSATMGAARANAATLSALESDADETSRLEVREALKGTSFWRVAQSRAAAFVLTWTHVWPDGVRPGVILDSMVGAPLTLFLVGVLALRLGVFDDPRGRRRLLIGAAAAGAALWAVGQFQLYKFLWPYLPVIPAVRVAHPVYRWFGLSETWFLAVTYAAGVTLLTSHSALARRALGAMFGAAGRLALTNYVLQAVLLRVVFERWGAGFGTIRAELVPLAAVGLFGLLAVLSRMWLDRFEHGPAEWVLRSMTYGARPRSEHRLSPQEA